MAPHMLDHQGLETPSADLTSAAIDDSTNVGIVGDTGTATLSTGYSSTETYSSSTETWSGSRREATVNLRELPRPLLVLDRLRNLPRDLGTESGWFNVASMVSVDFLALSALGILTMAAATLSGLSPGVTLPLLGVWLTSVLVAFYALGLYRIVMPLPAVELRWLLLTLSSSALFLTGALLATGESSWPKLLFIPVLAAVASFTLPFVRQIARRVLSRNRWWGRRVIVVGGGERSAAIVKKLSTSARLGLRPIGVLEEDDSLDSALHADVCLGPPERLSAVAEEHNVSMAIFVPGDLQAYSMLHLFHDGESRINSWLVVPPSSKLPGLWTEAFDLTGQPSLGWQNLISSWRHRLIKRLFDLTLVVLAMPLWLPLVGLIALAIKLTSRGDIFFVQERIGFRGQKFRCLKFRSMHPNSAEILDVMLKAHPELRAEFEKYNKLKNDPRVTWIGRIIRKTSLDELPQLFNVLWGEMSLVGPRPLLEKELEKYGEAFASYKQMRPGITGLWQISGRANTTLADRAWNDEYYVRNWSPWYDLYILGCTVQVVLRCEGAY